MPRKSDATNLSSDEDLHHELMQRLEHYSNSGDWRSLAKLIGQLPKSNRTDAVIDWIRNYGALIYRNREDKFTKTNRSIDLDSARNNPFWTLKKKRTVKKHFSGNSFEFDYFYNKFKDVINQNIDDISSDQLAMIEAFIARRRREKEEHE